VRQIRNCRDVHGTLGRTKLGCTKLGCTKLGSTKLGCTKLGCPVAHCIAIDRDGGSGVLADARGGFG
jgi:hypothetical protein